MYEGRRVRLRALEMEDAEACAGWLSDLDTARRVGGGGRMPITLEGEREWIRSNAGPRKNMNHFAIETLDRTFIGVCSYNSVNWQSRRCMIGLFIGEASMRGKGYGTDAIEVLLRICFEELDMHKVSLDVFSYNEPAVRLYEKLGFVREAVYRQRAYAKGRRWDEYGYAMLRREYDARDGGVRDV
jgi:RimJ/RimL family protein N-acetyltransferase